MGSFSFSQFIQNILHDLRIDGRGYPPVPLGVEVGSVARILLPQQPRLVRHRPEQIDQSYAVLSAVPPDEVVQLPDPGDNRALAGDRRERARDGLDPQLPRPRVDLPEVLHDIRRGPPAEQVVDPAPDDDVVRLPRRHLRLHPAEHPPRRVPVHPEVHEGEVDTLEPLLPLLHDDHVIQIRRVGQPPPHRSEGAVGHEPVGQAVAKGDEGDPLREVHGYLLRTVPRPIWPFHPRDDVK